MNFSLKIISATNLGNENSTNAMCIVHQTKFDDFYLGSTNIQEKTSDPIWNEEIQCHLIRGLEFTIQIVNKDIEKSNKKTLIGQCKLNIYNCKFNEEFEIPIIKPNDKNYDKNNSNHPKSILKIQISMIKKVKPICIKNPKNQIPINNIIYANLSFDPSFSPEFPIKNTNKFNFVCPPLDISFVGFDRNGEITYISSKSETINSKSCFHSQDTLCYCSDTFGPTIRIDLQKVFNTFNGFNRINSTVRGVFFVSIFNSAYQMDKFNWIALDFYISQEKQMKRTKNFSLVCNEKTLSNVYFHKRIPIPIRRSSTICGVVVLTLTENLLVEIEPINFSVPNANFNIPTYSVTEILPEIAQISQFPSFPGRYERRLSCPLGCSASLSRSLFINRIHTILPIEINITWKDYASKQDIELDASIFAFDKDYNVIQICSMNRQLVFNGGITHNGQMINNYIKMFVNFMKLPNEITYLCFCTSSFKPIEYIKYLELTMHMNGTVLYRVSMKKLMKQGLIFMYMKKEMNDWIIVPSLYQSECKTPTLIQKEVIQLCKSLF